MLPQVSLPTEHFFLDGVYVRVMHCATGTIVVGKQHKREHIFIVAAGAIAISDGSGPAKVCRAGEVFEAPPGVKRAALALEDSVCINVHRTDKTDLDEIEAELLEYDPTALLDARNQVKPEALEMEKWPGE